MKRAKVLAVVVGTFAMLGLSLSPVPALAIPQLIFNTGPIGGSIDFLGGVAPLTGAAITVNSVMGIGTTLNNGQNLQCFSCTLDFTTGAHIGGWNWVGGPLTSISITGEVDFNNDHIANDSGFVTLLTGSFGKASVFITGGTFKVTGSEFRDTKDPALIAHYGFTPPPYAGTFGLIFDDSTLVVGNPISSTAVFGGNVTNVSVPSVPEASSLLLLGSGLLSLAFWGRKKVNGVN